MRTFLPITLALSISLAGCGDDKKEAEKPEPPKDGLTKLIKEDIVIGKPTAFNPKMKPVASGDTLWVIYTGTLKNGLVFDGNDPKTKPDAKPYGFQIGVGGVIKGWDEGLLGMYPGGERKLSIPYKMAYNEQSRNKIPPYSDLYFTVKVVEVVKAGEERTYGVIDEKVGTGTPAKKGSKVTVHYRVKNVAGKVIEDTRDAKSIGKPITFKIGNEEALLAIEDGITGMKPGGIRQLAIPPMIGFTVSEQTGITANDFYYVRVELLKVE